MARYYFDSRDEALSVVDEEGLELDSLDAARNLALRALGEMVEAALAHHGDGALSVQVRDAAGKVVLKASLSYAVEVRTD